MEKSFETLITSYIKDNVGIAEDFLSEALCINLKENLLKLEAEDSMNTAGIGNDGNKHFDNLIRSDKIHWLDQKSKNTFEMEFFDKMDSFVAYLNESCYTSIKSYEFHYALYEPKAFYSRHLDQFKDDAKRQFSMINYLNADWKEQDGGKLLIYQDHNNQEISPTQGKTVFFKSDDLEHEILVTNKRRMSVTGWLKRG